MGFKENLAAAKAEVEAESKVKTAPVEVVLNGEVYEVVFYRLPNREWSAATIKHPPRQNVPMDLANGYDISGVAREVSVEYGRLIEDGEEVELDASEWASLWDVISPKAARYLEATVWFLHEREPEQEIEAAKKASRPVSKKKSS
jgi:hypothetical protein